MVNISSKQNKVDIFKFVNLKITTENILQNKYVSNPYKTLCNVQMKIKIFFLNTSFSLGFNYFRQQEIDL